MRATLVGADKLLLTPRSAGGTRFAMKTLSTMSHVPKHMQRQTLHTYFYHYTCENINKILTLKEVFQTGSWNANKLTAVMQRFEMETRKVQKREKQVKAEMKPTVYYNTIILI